MEDYIRNFGTQMTIGTVRRIAHDIVNKPGEPPICVIAPVRGGLVPGVMMSHRLGIPLFPLSYSLRDHKACEDIPDSVFEYVTRSANKRVILIDDIVDGGLTMKQLVVKLRERIEDIQIETAALIVNTAQDFIPDYIGWEINRDKDDDFIDFFWEQI